MVIRRKKVVQLGQEDSTAKVGANNEANGARNEGQAGNNTGSASPQSAIRSETNSNASGNASGKGLSGNLEGTSPKNDSTLQEVGGTERLSVEGDSVSRPSVSEKPGSGNVLDGRKGTGEPISNEVVGNSGRGTTDRGNDSDVTKGESVSDARPNRRGNKGDSIENAAKLTSTVNGNYHIDDPNALIGRYAESAFFA